jgi:CDP-diacylglycerol--serine O-phosphatidyltransferase
VNNFKGMFPGIFTVGNMFCGFFSIISSIRQRPPTEAAWLIILAAFLDMLDGQMARLSGTTTRFGVELDSFADFVSFAVAPAVMVYSFGWVGSETWAWLLGFVFILAGSFRLARFNLQADYEQKTKYLGLPLPVAAMSLAGFVIFSYRFWGEFRFEKILVVMLVGFSVLMVTNVEYEPMPRISLQRRKDRVKMLLLLLAGILAIIDAAAVVFPIVMAYFLYGLGREVYFLLSPERRALVESQGPDEAGDD